MKACPGHFHRGPLADVGAAHWQGAESLGLLGSIQGTRGLVAMTSAQHAEGRQFDPGRVYGALAWVYVWCAQAPHALLQKSTKLVRCE